MHSHRSAARPILAIVGGETLLGKEVRDLLEGSSLAVNIKLIAAEAEDDVRIIASAQDEPVVINSIQLADLGTAGVVVLAGSRESSLKAYDQIQKAKSTAIVIDMNGGLEDHPGSRLRAPMAEPPEMQAAAAIQVVAHPAADRLFRALACRDQQALVGHIAHDGRPRPVHRRTLGNTNRFFRFASVHKCPNWKGGLGVHRTARIVAVLTVVTGMAITVRRRRLKSRWQSGSKFNLEMELRERSVMPCVKPGNERKSRRWDFSLRLGSIEPS